MRLEWTSGISHPIYDEIYYTDVSGLPRCVVIFVAKPHLSHMLTALRSLEEAEAGVEMLEASDSTHVRAPTPYALYPTPYTLHPSPFTLLPYTLNPSPQTRSS